MTVRPAAPAVGLVGIGNMGLAMALRLHEAGFEVQWERPIGAWIWRDGLTGESLRARRPDSAPETWFQRPAWVPIAPAAVIVARKTSELRS